MPDGASWLLIVNPKSGRGRGRSAAGELGSRLGGPERVDVVETERRGHATEVAAERAGSVDRVVAVGGDGTLNEVLTGLLSTGASADTLPALGFLPSGTANVAGPAFGFPADPARSATLLASSHGRPVDVGVADDGAGGRPFLLWLGAGYDAVVIETLNKDRSGLMGVAGLVRNAPRVWRALGRYPTPPIAIGDGPGVGSVMVANVGAVAFGGSITPHADPSDGLLDCVTVPRLGRGRLPGLGARMLRAALDSHPAVTRTRIRELRLDTDLGARVPYHLDGEPVGTLPVEVRVAPAAIRLLSG